jgi:hypothetical protein
LEALQKKSKKLNLLGNRKDLLAEKIKIKVQKILKKYLLLISEENQKRIKDKTSLAIRK